MFTKVCKRCSEAKPIDSYYRHSQTKDKLHSICKACHNKESLVNYFKRKPSVAETRKEYHYQKSYGISCSEVLEMREAQQNKCKICLKETKLVVDHNHVTGKIRGLLCNKCNQGIGSLNDDPWVLSQAIEYLKNS